MTSSTTIPHQLSYQSDDDDDNTSTNALPTKHSRFSIDQGETRMITLPEAIGLDFNSFIPQADITSQVHFISNVRLNTAASDAGVLNGDRILQINGVNVTNLEHEDVRKLMQLMTPIVLTVANDPKYLALLQEPARELEEKAPEPPIIVSPEATTDSNNQKTNRSERQEEGASSGQTGNASGSSKGRSCVIFDLVRVDEAKEEEPLKAKECRLRKSKKYDGYGLVLKYQQDLHVIGQVEEASPSFRAGLRENDVIIFVGKKNVEKINHDEVKVLIRATALASDHVDLIVLSKSDLPRYKTLQEKGVFDWAKMGLEK